MSEELQPNAPAVESGSPEVDLGAAAPAAPIAEGEINWGDPEPVAEAPAAETPSAESTPEPVAEPELPAAKTEGYEFTTLQNGQRELTLETGQKYRGKDDGEIIAQLVKAQTNASRMIDDFKAKAAPVPVAEKPAEPVANDPATDALADLIAPKFGFKDGAELAEAFKALRTSVDGVNPVVEQIQNQRTAIQFIQATPEFAQINTPVNADKIDGWLNERRLPFTVQNAQDAFFSLKGRGELEAVPVQQTAPRAADGKFLKSNVMPMPPAASAPVAVAAKDPMAMSDKEFADWSNQLRRTS